MRERDSERERQRERTRARDSKRKNLYESVCVMCLCCVVCLNVHISDIQIESESVESEKVTKESEQWPCFPLFRVISQRSRHVHAKQFHAQNPVCTHPISRSQTSKTPTLGTCLFRLHPPPGSTRGS